jgi:hypothetical protein
MKLYRFQEMDGTGGHVEWDKPITERQHHMFSVICGI